MKIAFEGSPHNALECARKLKADYEKRELERAPWTKEEMAIWQAFTIAALETIPTKYHALAFVRDRVFLEQLTTEQLYIRLVLLSLPDVA